MSMRELASRCRSYRRFFQSEVVGRQVLEDLVDLARLTSSAANLQPLRYILSWDHAMNASIFDNVSWAAYLRDWPGPKEGERPSAYIVILGDEQHRRTLACDLGIAAQTIMLGAAEMGYGGCMIGSFKKEELSKVLNVPQGFEILLVVALGRPKEKVVIEPIGPDGDVRYWRDEKGVHHVPKRSLDDVILVRYADSGHSSPR